MLQINLCLRLINQLLILIIRAKKCFLPLLVAREQRIIVPEMSGDEIEGATVCLVGDVQTLYSSRLAVWS